VIIFGNSLAARSRSRRRCSCREGDRGRRRRHVSEPHLAITPEQARERAEGFRADYAGSLKQM
jgi:hypothetical protein